MVDASGQQLDAQRISKRSRARRAEGQVYNPEIGFALVGNTGSGLKYPYNPFYGEFSPRVAVAWAPKATDGKFSAKYSDPRRIRPAVRPPKRRGPGAGTATGHGSDPASAVHWGQRRGGLCRATARPRPTDAYRIGHDGLPLPTVPSRQSDTAATRLSRDTTQSRLAPAKALDPHFRPNVIDSFDFTIQRQLSRKVTLELGYIGRRITHEYLPLDINAVPYMMTKGGQTFANAYTNVVLQYCGGLPGMGGGDCAASAGCGDATTILRNSAGRNRLLHPGTCTATMVKNEGANLANALVWNLWSDLDGGVGCPSTGCTIVNGSTGGFNFPRSMQNTPIAANCGAGTGSAAKAS